MKRNTFCIPLPDDFSFAECLWFLDRNYDDCVHKVTGDTLYKPIMINSEVFLTSIHEKDKSLEVSILEGPADATAKQLVAAYISDWLDLDRDTTPFYKLLKKDKRTAYMVNDFKGLRLVSIPDLFEAICWSVIGQQINLTFAYKLKRRLTEKYGISITYKENIYHIFPDAATLALADPAELRAMQFSAAKVTYITETAKAFANGLISKDQLQKLPDVAARRAFLTSLKGIGFWTANYTLMKSLKEPACIPYGDAGLLNALIAHNILQDKKDNAALDAFFAKFRGWESYLVFYLWRSLAKK